MGTSLVDAEPTLSPPRWTGPTRLRSIQEVGVLVFLIACAAVTILTTVGIVVVLGVEAIQFFRVSGESPIGFLFGTRLEPEASPPRFGILPLIWGTMVIALGSSVIALPIGLLSAIFLSEYAPARVRSVLKPTLELLAGIPTIVYGYLALLLVTPVIMWLVRPFGLSVETFNALSACVVVGIMVIPMVSSLSEDVLSAVPRGPPRSRLCSRRHEVRGFDEDRPARRRSRVWSRRSSWRSAGQSARPWPSCWPLGQPAPVDLQSY